MTSPAHEEMVEVVAAAIVNQMFVSHELPLTDPWLIAKYRETAKAVLAVVFERLKVVTPQMGAAGVRASMRNGDPLWTFLFEHGKDVRDIAPAFLAMLAAAPLTPGDGE